MNLINVHTYEAFYLDYLEGNLSPEATAKLLLFLEENPLLKLELEGFELIEVRPEPKIAFDKQALKKEITGDNVEEYIVAAVEKEITPEDALELEIYLIQSPEAQVLEARYRKTILSSPEISFPKKSKLKREDVGTIRYLIPAMKVAATVLLLLVVAPRSPDQSNSLALWQTETIAPGTFQEPIVLAKTPIVGNASVKDAGKATVLPPENTEPLEESLEEQVLVVELPVEGSPPVVLPMAIEVSPEQENPEFMAKIEVEPPAEEHVLAELAAQSTTQDLPKVDTPAPTKVDANEILATLISKLDEKTKAEIAYHHTEDENRTSYSFSIGNFEFSRSKSR